MYLYVEAATVFHRLHPVTKLIFLISLILSPFFISSLSGMVALLIFNSILLLASRGSGNFLRAWKLLIVFWIFTFFIWIIIPRLRHQPWSYETAATLATRVDLLVIAGLWFGTITRIEEFMLALTKLGFPYKPAFSLSLGFRLVPLFYQNLQIIVAAQRSRGVDLDSGGLIRKARNYFPIMGILLSYGIRNADMMAMSLEAKGFGFPGKRTSYLHPQFALRDALFLLFAIVLPTATILI